MFLPSSPDLYIHSDHFLLLRWVQIREGWEVRCSCWGPLQQPQGCISILLGEGEKGDSLSPITHSVNMYRGPCPPTADSAVCTLKANPFQ